MVYSAAPAERNVQVSHAGVGGPGTSRVRARWQPSTGDPLTPLGLAINTRPIGRNRNCWQAPGAGVDTSIVVPGAVPQAATSMTRCPLRIDCTSTQPPPAGNAPQRWQS